MFHRQNAVLSGGKRGPGGTPVNGVWAAWGGESVGVRGLWGVGTGGG